MDRRTFTCMAGLLALGRSAYAADDAWPRRPVTLVVPFSPGSIVDLQGRVIARGLAARLGQPVVVENRPGVAGSLGAEAVARAPADGYTLLLGTQGTHGTNLAMYKAVRYDPVKDFVAVHGLSGNANVLVVNPGLKVATAADLVELAKRQPGKLNFGSGGAGTAGHLCLELLQARTGARFTHIPYKASSAALVDLVSGNLDAMFDFLMTSLPHIRSGKLKPLAVTSPARMPGLPQVPTTAEAGLPGVDALSWGGLFAPAGTPAAIVQRLSDEAAQVMRSAEVQSTLESAASFTLNMPHAQFQDYVAREASKWTALLRDAGIRPE
jgi:tripartite-type tricarboxylate transporter receptor subunit TctC